MKMIDTLDIVFGVLYEAYGVEGDELYKRQILKRHKTEVDKEIRAELEFVRAKALKYNAREGYDLTELIADIDREIAKRKDED